MTGVDRGSGRAQHLDPIGAYPALLIYDHPLLRTMPSLGAWLVQAAMMGA